jgi:hypothetical protein
MHRRSFLGLLAAAPAAWTQDGHRGARRAPTQRARPPRGATVLFDGDGLEHWVTRDGAPAGWKIERRYVEVVPGAGDILSTERFTDFQLHVEFWLPLMAEASGQARANSGVYLQGRYEVQVLDSFGQPPHLDTCGAIYGVAAPLRNAGRPPQRWQTYDIVFRGARGGDPPDPARVTVWHNGVAIHNNVAIPSPTGGTIDGDTGSPGPLLLQDHGDPVRYRNIWVLPA